MIKVLLVGLWAGFVTAAATYGMMEYKAARAGKPVAAAAVAVETRKTKEINIPRIKNGVIKGYVVAQFSYVVDMNAAKKIAVPPDAFVVDEAFRFLYQDETIDFDHLEKFDLNTLTKTLVKSVNARLKGEAVLDIGVQEFTFLPSAEAKQHL
jgi:hypothetical protein